MPSDYYEPGVVVQAGPGLPDWQYHVYEFSWTGPVEANATGRFLISPPWMTRLWRVLGIALCVWLLLELIRKDLPSLPAWLRRGPLRVAAALLLVLLAAFGAAPRAQASTTPIRRSSATCRHGCWSRRGVRLTAPACSRLR